jgi:hypothetical protein
MWTEENLNNHCKTCPSDPLSKANITRNVPDSNPGSGSEPPATNHDAAFEGMDFKQFIILNFVCYPTEDDVPPNS